MQRVLRSPSVYAALSSAIDSRSDVLSHVCPTPLANMFASSRCGSDGQLEWWSPLEGHPVAFADLTVLEQQQLLKTLAQRKDELTQFAQELAAAGQDAAAQTLKILLSSTDASQLYSIDQQPVLVEWQATLRDDLLPKQMLPSAADTAAMVMAANAAKAFRVRRPLRQSIPWSWLLFFIALLALVVSIRWF